MAQESIEDAGDSSRRASGRSRKLTAKAQALSESKPLPGDSRHSTERISLTQSTSPDTSSEVNESVTTSTRKSSTPSIEVTSSLSKSTPPRKLPKQPIGDSNSTSNTQSPSEEDNVVRSSKRERKPTARALQADQTELEELLAPRKRSASPTREEPPNKIARKSVGQPPKVPSRLRHSVTAHEESSGPEVAINSGIATTKPLTLKLKTSEASKVDRPRHHNQFTKAKEREALARASIGAQSSTMLESSNSNRPKHNNQHTKAREREAAARAAGEVAGVSYNVAATVLASPDRPKHPNQHTKRKEREAAARATLGVDEDTHMSQASGFAKVSQMKNKQTATGRNHEGQKRLILTLPLPSSPGTTSPTFPARARKAEFLDKGCQLFCLDAAARILAFAEIAAESADSDDEGDVTTGPTTGLYEKWLAIGRKRFCVCGKPGQTGIPIPFTEDEYTQILESNEAIQSPGNERATKTSKTSSAMSFPPLNSIVPASEGIKVSTYYQVIAGSAPPPPAITNRETKIGPSGRRPSQRGLASSSSTSNATTSGPLNILGGGSYENRMRDDFRALEQARRQAHGHGIGVRQDHSLDQLRILIQKKEHEQKSASPAGDFGGVRNGDNGSAGSNLYSKGVSTSSKAASSSSSRRRPTPSEEVVPSSSVEEESKREQEHTKDLVGFRAMYSPIPRSPGAIIPKKRKPSAGELSPGSSKQAKLSKNATAAPGTSKGLVVD